jgi:methyl-accepting chemotaxis protein
MRASRVNTDESKMVEIDAELRKNRDGLEKELKDYEALLSDDKDKQMLADDRSLAADYFVANEQVLTLSRANKNEQARALQEKNKTLADKVKVALDAHMRYNEDLAKAGAAQAVAEKHSALTISIFFTGLLLAATIGGSMVVTRSITRPINAVVNDAGKMAVGDFSFKMDVERKDEVGKLLDSMRSLQAAMQRMIADADMLVNAAVAGKLATRAEATRHQGDFRKIVDGVNQTLDAVIGPLNVAGGYVDRISRGETPPKITDNYNGDFNVIKNNLNILIDAMERVTRVAQEIAGGNLQIEVRERSEKDDLMKALATMVKKLSDVAVNVKMSSDNVAVGTQQINASTEQLSQGATEQASSIEEISSRRWRKWARTSNKTPTMPARRKRSRSRLRPTPKRAAMP